MMHERMHLDPRRDWAGVLASLASAWVRANYLPQREQEMGRKGERGVHLSASWLLKIHWAGMLPSITVSAFFSL